MDSAVISSPVNGLFVELVQVSMGIKPTMSRMPTMTEWDEMFVLAMSNYVEGICFQGVVRLAEMNGGGCRQIGIDQDTFHRWATKTYRIVDRNKVIADQCRQVMQSPVCIVRETEEVGIVAHYGLGCSHRPHVVVGTAQSTVEAFVEKVAAAHMDSHRRV